MFGWLRPSCPVDAQAKAWIERRLDWLGDQFGVDVFTRRAVVLPDSDFFPDAYDRSEATVRGLLDRVCRYMEVDPDIVDLELFADRNPLYLINDRGEALPTTAGLYDEQPDRVVIHLEISQLDDPMALVGTMAHELAHYRLIGEGRITGDEFDNELLTDLTSVFHGMGIFLANQPRAWPSQFTTWPETDVRRPEYMTGPMFGYALAHSAWFRGESKPHWSKHLCMDARPSFKQALRYLWETSDSSFRPRDGR